MTSFDVLKLTPTNWTVLYTLLLYFSVQDFHRRIVPKNGLDKVIVTDRLAQNLDEIVQFEKARSVITYTLISPDRPCSLISAFHSYMLCV